MGVHEEPDDYAEEASSGYRKRKASSSLPEDLEDEEDEEDEEYEESERRRRGGASFFVDDYAGVDEGEEEEEEEEELDGDDLIVDSHEDLPAEEHHSQRIYGPIHDQGVDDDPEAWERYISERYEAQHYDPGEASAATQQSLLPTLKDPKLWVVQCRPGCERLLCIQLLRKYHASNRGNSLMIRSAVCLDHLKGYFYVEAEKEAFVREAVKGLNNVFMSKGVKLVPLGEMVDAITVNKNAKLALEKGSWVRVRTGPYEGDLAKVLDVDLANQKVTVKVIPRIDFTELANREEGRPRRGLPFGHGQRVRPAAKPFNKEFAQSLGLSLYRRRVERMTYICVDKHHFLYGYLVKTLALRSIVAQESVPPLEELQRFNAAGQVNGEDAEEDFDSMLGALPEGKHGLKKGDEVVVTKGELRRLTGIVKEIKEDDRVKVLLDHAELTDALVFDAGDLTKHFQVGDHVRVDGGVHEGEIGMVIKLDDAMCRVMSDTTKKELRVNARDLCKAEQSHVGLDKIGDYELHDLVELDNSNYGVIIFVSKDFCKVLMADGTPDKPEVRIAGLVDIRNKVNTRRNSTTDRFSNRVKTDDVVDIIHGPMKGTSGTVVYIIKGYLFIKCQEIVLNLGFIAVSARSCCVRGGRNLPGRSVDALNSRTPTAGNATPASFKSPRPSHMQSPTYDGGDRNQGWISSASPRRAGLSNGHDGGARDFGGGGGGGGGWRGGRGYGGRGGRGSHLFGKTVKVVKGPNRGYRGRVKGETDAHVRVELEANCKVVTVHKEHIDAGYEGDYPQRRSHSRAEPPSTPWHSPKTPMHTPSNSWGSRTVTTMTPLHRAMTPLHTISGSRTPSRTPMHHSMPESSPSMQYGASEEYGSSQEKPTMGSSLPPTTPMMSPPSDLNFASKPGEETKPVDENWGDLDEDTNTESASVQYPPSRKEEPASPGTTGVVSTSEAKDAAVVDEADLTALWKGIIVELPDTSGKQGCVTSVGADGMCEISELVQDDEASSGFRESWDTYSLNLTSLVPVQAQKQDQVRVLSGDGKGSTGVMVGNDGSDGIVKIAGSQDIRVLEIATIGRVFAGMNSATA